MAKVIEAPILTTSTTTPEIKTLNSLRSKYRSLLALAKLAGFSDVFVKEAGSEKQYMSQFKRQSYDGGC